MCCECVYDEFLYFDFWKVLSDLPHLLQEKAVGHLESVGLVDGGELLLTLHGQFKGTPCDPFGAVRRDFADRERNIRRWHDLTPPHEHVAVGIEALGCFAHDDKV